MVIPIKAFRPRISIDAKASPAGRNIGQTDSFPIVIKKLNLASETWDTTITKIDKGSDLTIKGAEYE